MRCEEFLRLLDDGADVTNGDAGDHLGVCLSCRRAVDRWEAVRGELGAMRSDEAPPFLHTRIMAHVREAGRAPERRAWWARRPAWAMPLVVTAIIVAAGGYGLFEVMRPSVEPVPMMSAADQRKAATGFERKDAERDRVAATVPAPARRAEATRAMPAPSGPRVVGGTPLRASKGEAAGVRRAEKQAAPMSFAKEDRASTASSDQPQHDALAANVPEPSPSFRDQIVVSQPVTELAAGTQKASAAAARAAEVICVVRPFAGGASVRVPLASPNAPPAGEDWHVDVTRGGSITVSAAGPVLDAAVVAAVQRALGLLHLAEGQYTLRREREP